MRRLAITAAVAAVTAASAGLAINALAGPVPLNQQTEVFAIHQAFQSVVVTSDYGSIDVRPGDTAKVTATEAWNLYAPTVTVVVRNGVLHVDATCTNATSVAGVTTVGAVTDPANDCTDQLEIVVPSSVTLTAMTDTGHISTRSIDGAQKLNGNFGVSVIDAGSSVDAQSDNGPAWVSRMHGSLLRVRSLTENARAFDVNASSIQMSSSNGAVGLTRAVAHTVTLSSDATNVIVTKLTADTLLASSSNGEVQVDHSHISAINVHSDTSSVTVNDVVAPSITATSSNGIVSVEAVNSDAIVASSDAADVQVATVNRPVVTNARSSNGAVFVDVPHGAYAITASTDNGTLTLNGVQNQPHAKHRIVAHSDANNVTINGH